jgi:hypothetical protein
MKELTIRPFNEVVDYVVAREGSCLMIDQRDRARLTEFVTTVEELDKLGYGLEEGKTIEDLHNKEWNIENVLVQVKADIDFALEKAEGERGISSSLMHEVLQMWNFAFNTDVPDKNKYNDYGLDYIHRTAKAFDYEPGGTE